MKGTARERVKALVERQSPEPVCDDCITNTLGLTVHQHANHKTCELAGSAGFERKIGECALCGMIKKVIRRKR